MTVSASLEKRLQQLGDAINYRGARTIVITVPTKVTPVPNSVEVDAIVTPETRVAVDAILEAIGVGEQDTVVEVSRFTTGGLPKLISVT